MKYAIGSITYVVEWCAGCPTDEAGDADLDRADYRRERFASEAAAVNRAEIILRKNLDFFGAPHIEKQVCEVDQDILRCERRRVLVWTTIGNCEISDCAGGPAIFEAVRH